MLSLTSFESIAFVRHLQDRAPGLLLFLQNCMEQCHAQRLLLGVKELRMECQEVRLVDD